MASTNDGRRSSAPEPNQQKEAEAAKKEKEAAYTAPTSKISQKETSKSNQISNPTAAPNSKDTNSTDATKKIGDGILIRVIDDANKREKTFSIE